MLSRDGVVLFCANIINKIFVAGAHTLHARAHKRYLTGVQRFIAFRNSVVFYLFENKTHPFPDAKHTPYVHV